jgi:anti-anti-sigma regulatory factor
MVRMRSEMLALLAVNQTLRVSRDLSTLYRVVASQLANVIRFDSLFIALYVPETDMVRFVYSVDEGVAEEDENDERPLDSAPLSARVVRTRQMVKIDDLDHDPTRARGTLVAFGNTERRSRSWLAVPMISGDTLQGVLGIQSYQPAAFSSADAELLLLFSSQVGIAIENAQLFARLKRTVIELSTPLIPVADGVLVLPLIGTIDVERASRVLEQVLDAIVVRQADRLLIDVTGVSAVDSFVVDQLLKIVRTAALLGAQCSIVGINASIAQAATELQLDLHGLRTFRDLQSALAVILQLEGKGT